MSTTSVSDLLASAQIGPDDTPGTAAALLWGRLADAYDVPADSPVAPLGVLHRVVLVLMDVAQLTDAEVAHHLNTDPATIAAAHAAARTKVGLPPVRAAECPEWEMVRSAHRFGDPATVRDIVDHVAACAQCTEVAEEHGSVRRWWAKRALLLSPAAAGGVFTVVPAFAAGLALAAALVGGAIYVAKSGERADPLRDLPDAIVVEDAPALPSDQEPAGGWPAGTRGAVDTGAVSTGTDDAPSDTTTDAVDDLTDTVTDTAPPTDDITDTVTDTVDPDEVVDDLTEQIDDATGGVGGVVEDLVDSFDDAVQDVPSLEILPERVPDVGRLLPGPVPDAMLEPLTITRGAITGPFTP